MTKLDPETKRRAEQFRTAIEQDILGGEKKSLIVRNYGQYIVVCNPIGHKTDQFIGHLHVLADPTVYVNSKPATREELGVMLDVFVRAKEGRPARTEIKFRPAK